MSDLSSAGCYDLNMTTDRELIRQFADERAEPALAELIRRHVDLVFSTALRQVGGDAHFAQDVVQQVFIDLARKASALKHRTVLEGWLYTSTHYAASNLVRAERRRRRHEQEAVIMTESASITPPTDWEKLRPLLDQAMHQLNETDREAVLLRYFARKPIADVGARLGLSENAAAKRIERALEKLYTLLAKRGVTSTSAALGVMLANQAVAMAPVGLAANLTGAALATTAAGGGALGIAGFWTFMSSTKTMVGIASMVALVACVSAVYEGKRASRAEATLNSAAHERDALNKKFEAIGRRAERAEAELVSLQRAVPARKGDASATTAPAAQRSGSGLSAELEQILAHPELREVHLESRALRTRALLERYFRATGVTPEEQARVLKASVEMASADLDLIEAMRAHGYVNSWEGFSKETVAAIQRTIGEEQKKRNATYKDELRQALGDERYDQYWEYWKTMSGRLVADELASRLYFTESPLTVNQANELAQILRQDGFLNSRPVVQIAGTSVDQKVFVKATQEQARVAGVVQIAPITDDAIAHAQELLAPAQLAVLRHLQDKQRITLRFSSMASSPSR